MSFTLVPVTRTYLDEDDQPRSGTVRLQLTGVLHNDGAFAGRNVHAVSLDAAGTASLLVPATNDPSTLPESGGTYEVTEALSGLPTETYYIAVPFDGGPVDLIRPGPWHGSCSRCCPPSGTGSPPRRESGCARE